MCVFWLLRELEASTALRSNVRLNHRDKTATFRLSASKCDPRALGVERTWGCVCADADDGGAPACPYHAAVRQHAILEDRFGKIKEDDRIPMFPTETGDMMTGEDVVKLIEYIATLLGDVLTLKGGVRRYGKHSWRATGAVYFAALGLNMHKIGMLARWASPIILHYARVAPLKL